MDLRGKTIVISTTNGTQAINTGRDARTLVIGSFLNLSALTEWLLKQNDNILLLCSGWKNKFSLEDSVFAGAVMDRLLASGKFGLEEDSSIASKYLFMAARDNFMSILKAAPRRRRLQQAATAGRCEVLPHPGPEPRDPRAAQRPPGGPGTLSHAPQHRPAQLVAPAGIGRGLALADATPGAGLGLLRPPPHQPHGRLHPATSHVRLLQASHRLPQRPQHRPRQPPLCRGRRGPAPLHRHRPLREAR
jgi:hypothetical protein